LFGWAALALALKIAGVSGDVTRLASRASLIPLWFLAIYIVVVVLAPAVYRAWQRWGFASFWAFVVLAGLVDYLYFVADQRWLGWTNYLWVWLAIHQLGFAWRDGRMGSPLRLLLYSGAGLLALILLIFEGPYPLAMVGSPDKSLSNSLPPKITLIALGVFQAGLLLSIEAPMRRLLSSVRLWAATVLINSMIMTVYLWHLTVMVVVISLAFLAGGLGLQLEPGSSEWWLSRPLWIAVLYAVLLPVALLLSSFERQPRPADAPVPPAARQVIGALMIGVGVAVLAFFGFGTTPLPEMDIAAFAMVVVGAAISGLLHGFKK
jgi:hypothetical protein